MNFKSLTHLIPEWGDVGGLSSNSKMPGLSWGVPIAVCSARKEFAADPTSICSKCYCKKGRQRFPASLNAQRRRLKAYLDQPDVWIYKMGSLLTRLFNPASIGTMRWFDSGDLATDSMLKDIIQVCAETPEYQHWISTQDSVRVFRFFDLGGVVPDNTTIRLSNHWILGSFPFDLKWKGSDYPGLTRSFVSPKDGFEPKHPNACPAYQSKPAKCGSCRKCWDREQPAIVYPLH